MCPIPVHADSYYVIVDLASDGTEEAKHWSNTLFFKDDGAIPLSHAAAADAVKVLLDDFYGDILAPGTGRLSNFMSNYISTADCRYRVYDLNLPAPRTPEVRTWGGGAVGTSGGPTELCGVLSYRSGPGGTGGGTVNKRARGRLYIGPITDLALANGTGGYPDDTLSTGFVNAMLGAGDFLRDQAVNDLTWVQYSRVNDLLANVTGGFVDNAVDIQRRRGSGGTARTVW